MNGNGFDLVDGQMGFFNNDNDNDNDTTADGTVKRVYTTEDKLKGKHRINATLDWCREEAYCLRYFMDTFFAEAKAGRKMSGNSLSYLALWKTDLADHNGEDFNISHDVGPVLMRMIVNQWPEFAPLCNTKSCVLDCDELAPMIPPLGEVVDLGDLLSA